MLAALCIHLLCPSYEAFKETQFCLRIRDVLLLVRAVKVPEQEGSLPAPVQRGQGAGQRCRWCHPLLAQLSRSHCLDEVSRGFVYLAYWATTCSCAKVTDPACSNNPAAILFFSSKELFISFLQPVSGEFFSSHSHSCTHSCYDSSGFAWYST